MKCSCGNYYADVMQECPECGVDNPMNKFRDAGLKPRSFEKLSADSFKTRLIAKFGEDVKKHFTPIDECWSQTRCLQEIRNMSMGKWLKNSI